VHVIRAGETTPSPQRLPDSALLEEGRGNREPGEGEPGERGQDEDPDEKANRQKDEDADPEGGEECPARRPLPRREHAGADVGECEQRSRKDEQRRLDLRPLADRKLVERGDDRTEREGAPEMPPVEPDRLGHELTDRLVGWMDSDLAGNVHAGKLQRVPHRRCAEPRFLDGSDTGARVLVSAKRAFGLGRSPERKQPPDQPPAALESLPLDATPSFIPDEPLHQVFMGMGDRIANAFPVFRSRLDLLLPHHHLRGARRSVPA
jgi:hypothetical protein